MGKLTKFSNKRVLSVQTIALLWAHANSNIKSILIRIRNVSQLNENIKSFYHNLDRDDIHEVTDIIGNEKYSI